MTPDEIQKLAADFQAQSVERIARAMEKVLALLLAMPGDIPQPVLRWEEDGAVELDWYWGIGRVVSLTVCENGQCYFAGLIEGADNDRGSFVFDGTLPDSLVKMIRRGAELGCVE